MDDDVTDAHTPPPSTHTPHPLSRLGIQEAEILRSVTINIYWFSSIYLLMSKGLGLFYAYFLYLRSMRAGESPMVKIV